MQRNKITAYDLQKRATALKAENKPYREIASILSKESKKSISYGSVKRFFDTDDDAKVKAVEKSKELQARVAVVEINTIEQRQAIVQELIEISRIAKEEKDYKTAVAGLDKAIVALDSLDKRTGKLTSGPVVQFNSQEITNNNITLVEKMKEYDHLFDE